MKELKLLSLVLVAGTATMFTACTSESDNSPSANISYESVAAAQQVPVTFGTYMGETPVTRAGTAGNIADDGTNSAEANLVAKGGFGVFAYYNNAGNYPETLTPAFIENNSLEPNFMYNQLVNGVVSGAHPSQTVAWSYTPLKYWPNDFANNAAVDNQNTPTATDQAKGSKATTVSFFAYAPYVHVVASSGALDGTNYSTESIMEDWDGNSTPETEVGITGLTGNSVTTDPRVSYTIATIPSNSVDLLWGVAPGTSGTENYNITTGGTQGVAFGMPNKNLTKQTNTEKIEFSFNHALAKLGLTVQAARDQVAAGPGGVGDKELWEASDPAHKTRIYVNSVTITSSMKTSGKLNLNNQTANTAKWENLSGDAAPTTLNVNGGNINPDLVFDSTLDLDNASQKPGVLAKSSTNLMVNGTTNVYFMLIPQTTGTIDVVIDYDVMTLDGNLSGGKSTVNNRIKKTISALAFNNGYEYTLNLVLGMNSVDINATVAPWTAGGAIDPVNLPINVN